MQQNFKEVSKSSPKAQESTSIGESAKSKRTCKLESCQKLIKAKTKRQIFCNAKCYFKWKVGKPGVSMKGKGCGRKKFKTRYRETSGIRETPEMSAMNGTMMLAALKKWELEQVSKGKLIRTEKAGLI